MSVKKTWWPYGIVGVILFGVLLLVALVYVSVHQVNLNDNAYMQDYNDVDKNINNILSITEEFLQDYEIKAFVDSKPIHFLIPYEQKRQSKQKAKIILPSNSQHKVFVEFISKHSKFKIQNYAFYVSRYYDRKYKNHYDVLEPNGKDFIFHPVEEGRYKLILEITLIQNDKTLPPIFLQQDITIKTH